LLPQELVNQVAIAMDRILVFNRAKNADLETILSQLATKLDGFRRSFECPFSNQKLLRDYRLCNYPHFIFSPNRYPRLRQHLCTQDLAGGALSHHQLQRGEGRCLSHSLGVCLFRNYYLFIFFFLFSGVQQLLEDQGVCLGVPLPISCHSDPHFRPD